MYKQKVNTRNIVLVLMIIALIPTRLISYKYPELSNFTPFGAIALFGGACFTEKWKAFLVVILGLFISDIFINYLYTAKWILFYRSSIWLYLFFTIMVVFGTLIKKADFGRIAAASVISVLIHWLVLELPWIYGTQYTHDLSGYMLSLTNAIPFERNMLLGDAVYGAILFGGFELIQRKYGLSVRKPELAV